METKRLTGAEIIWECLVREGVDVVFGYPGGAILPAYDALNKYDDKIHHVLTRHEQGATHMADGYARSSGKVGVAIATSGPGAANMVTGLATAMMDSTPIVCITGQVPRAAIGSDAFQEMDISGAVIPVTKHSYLVMDIKDLARTIKEAFAIARSGRPGPVLIDIPMDMQWAEINPDELRGFQPPNNQPTDSQSLIKCKEMISNSLKPLIIAGGGIRQGDAVSEFKELIENYH